MDCYLTFRRLAILLPAAMLLFVIVPREAQATLKYQKVFVEEHLTDHTDEEFIKFVKRKVKCNICHQGRKDRTNHNAYGIELAALIDFETDEDDLVKVAEAIRTVAEMPSDPTDPGGKTFGQLILESTLPGGELDELKKEPAEQAELADLPQTDSYLE